MLKTTAAILVAGALAACATGGGGETGTTGGMGEEGVVITPPVTSLPEWKALLAANEGYAVTGEASVHGLADGQTRVAVEIEGGEPNRTHPWHIHEGTCGSGGPIVGDGMAYMPLTVDEEGEASASATLNVTLDPDRHYYLNIHKSPTEAEKIVSCGELQRE